MCDTIEDVPIPGETILLMEHLETTPVNADQIREWTAEDPVLTRVLSNVQNEWNANGTDDSMKAYFIRRSELSCHDGVILWGSRVVVPKPGRAALLNYLHEGHPGIVRMKALARSHVWWPGIDSDIEGRVQACSDCQLQRPIPPVAPLHSWDWPDRPWSRIHVDYAGPFIGQMFLIVVDSHSKWLEVIPTNSATSTTTISKLRQIFAAHGLPEMVVSDNGPCFVSDEFATFMSENGIKHVKTSPYHPASNGLAARSVRIFKEGMKKMSNSGGDTMAKLSRFLLAYRSTPQTTTGLSPAELLFNRKVRTKLDLVKPEVRERVMKRQQAQKDYHDTHARDRTFAVGDRVFVKNFYAGPKWKSAEIVAKNGPVSYKVEGENGVVARRHVDHIRQRHCMSVSEPDISQDILDNPIVSSRQAPTTVVETKREAPTSREVGTCQPTPERASEPGSRPQRQRRPPAHLDDFVRPK